MEPKYQVFKTQLELLLNKLSMENESNTPDFLLAEYLTNCLVSYNKTVTKKAKWNTGAIEKVL